MPSKAKTPITKRRNDTRNPIFGNDFNRIITNLFMLGTALMLRSGLNTLIVLRALRFGMLGKRDKIPMITTIKSKTFQGFLM